MKPAAIKKLVLALACFLMASAYGGLAPSRAENSSLEPGREGNFFLTGGQSASGRPEVAQGRERRGREGFPHEQQRHREIACSQCHLYGGRDPVDSDKPMAKNFPHATCISCHNFAEEFFKMAIGGGSRFCTICHEQRRITPGNKALKGLIASRPSDFADQFSHEAHRRVVPAFVRIRPASDGYGSHFRVGQVTGCVDCHRLVRGAPPAEKDTRTENSHAACFVCHGGAAAGERQLASDRFPLENDCGVCHELKATNRSRDMDSIFGTVRGFRHIDHDIDITPKKKSFFAENPDWKNPERLCVECHHPVAQTRELADIGVPKVGYCDRCHIDRKPGLPSRLSDEIRSKLATD